MTHQSHEHGPEAVTDVEARPKGASERGGPASLILGLQRAAGNRAVGLALQRTVAVGPVTRNTYEIEATTLEEAGEAIDEHNPREAAETQWFPGYNATTNGSTVTAAAVNVPVSVEMPAWPGASALSTAAQAEWTRFHRALGAHEDGHVSRVRTGFARSDNRLLRKTEDAAATEFQTIVDTVRANSDAYDTRTDHGRNNGTIIDTTIT